MRMISHKKKLQLNHKGFIKNTKQIPSPNYNARPKDTEINLIVIHNISLPPNQYGGNFIEQFFTNKLDSNKHPYFKEIKNVKVSSHFVIDRKGDLIQYVSCNYRAWHAGISEWNGKDNCNNYSIGIELEGSDHLEYDNAQYEKLNQLIDCLKSIYNIKDIVGHCDIAPGRKTDPGPLFNWDLINIGKNT